MNTLGLQWSVLALLTLGLCSVVKLRSDFKPKDRTLENSQAEVSLVVESDKGSQNSHKISNQYLIDNKENAALIIEYSDEARQNFVRVSSLPKEYQIQFLDELEKNPTADTTQLAAQIISNFEVENFPYKEPKLNEILAEARKLGPQAESEFKKVVSLLGDKISPEQIQEKIREKFGVFSEGNVWYQIVETRPNTFEIQDNTGRKIAGTGSYKSRESAKAAFEYIKNLS